MDSPDEVDDVVDDVNELLKRGVGDPYRLEHIKQAYIENKNVWESDKRYLQKMKDKYLTKLQLDEKTDAPEIEEESDSGDTIHCWKCGKKCPLKANFCMTCGAHLFDVGNTTPQTTQETVIKTETVRSSIGIKIPIMIGIPVIILAVLGAAYSQGYFDGAFERDEPQDIIVEPTISDDEPLDSNSKCGRGTIFDEETNSCVLENSKCGKGTIYDPKTNSCILD